MTDNNEKATLFLCWSGSRGKRVAECLRDYFNEVFDKAARVEMSDTIIEKGAAWSGELQRALRESRAGIVCLTPENRTSGWLHFEGGALALGSDRPEKEGASARDKLFCFLLTMDNTQLAGPLSLFQATTYRREYDRDREELAQLTKDVAKLLEADISQDPRCMRKDLNGAEDPRLDSLVARLRELDALAFRVIVPGLEQHARRLILAADNPGQPGDRVQMLSAMISLQRLLEDRRCEMEVICPSAQLMFFERLIELLSSTCRELETAISQPSEQANARLGESVWKLRRILEAAIEPIVPVLDDSWRYAFYAQHEDPGEAYRKQKLLLIHPLETNLQRAELESEINLRAEDTSNDEYVRPKHLLSPKEKRQALRSYWAFDRIAAYIHYSEDVSPAGETELKTALMDLVRAVLKEISLLELPAPRNDEERQPDDLPLRFALRALLGKVKLAIGYGRHRPEPVEPELTAADAYELLDERIKAETGLSFSGPEEFLEALRKLQKLDEPDQTRQGPSGLDIRLKPPIASLCDDFERLVLAEGRDPATLVPMRRPSGGAGSAEG